MPRRDVAIEIFMPTEGLHKEVSESMITPRSTPYCKNANAYYGAIQKDYGTTLFCTGCGGISNTVGAAVVCSVEARFSGGPALVIFTNTGMHKYSSGLDAFVTDSPAYTGTFPSNQWFGCMHNNAFVYSNFGDLVQYKAALATTGTQMLGVESGSYKAYAIVSFAEHLNLYHTMEGGTECRKRVRWTKVGLLNFNSADWSGAGSGFLDVLDADGDILTAEKIGAGNVAVYADNSVHIQSWVGGTNVYRFDKVLANINIPSRRGVVANDQVHYILTRDNIGEYWGGRDIRWIGDPIKARYVQVKNDTALSYAFLEYIGEDDELRVHIPTGTSTYPDKCFICKVKDNYAWYEGDSNYTAPGKFTTPSALTIGELLGNIGAQNWRFGDLVPKAGAVTPLLGDASGRVVQRNKTVYSVSKSGTSGPQEFIFDTKDLSSIKDIDPFLRDKYNLTQYMDNESRWLTCTVEAKGYGNMYMQYSIDGGVAFSDFSPSYAALDSRWDTYDFDVDVANPNLMVRITNTGTNEVVHVRYIKVEFVPGGEVG